MCKAFTLTLTGVKRPRLLKTLDSSALLPLVDERTRTQSLGSGENRGQNKRTREDDLDDFTPMTKQHSTPHSAAPLQSELESRGHKRRREEDDSLESFKTKRQNYYSTRGSSDEVITISDDDDDVIILNPTTPPDRGYGKRPSGNKPHRRKTGSKK